MTGQYARAATARLTEPGSAPFSARPRHQGGCVVDLAQEGGHRLCDLGLCRILGPGNEYQELEAFVREWLGPLIDYDGRHRTALVETLSRYFDCGGNYAETAESLAIHRSTLRYRLQRIREISGHDLTNVEDRLNLQVATRVWKIMLGGPG
jgi:hypothetical protein